MKNSEKALAQKQRKATTADHHWGKDQNHQHRRTGINNQRQQKSMTIVINQKNNGLNLKLANLTRSFCGLELLANCCFRQQAHQPLVVKIDDKKLISQRETSKKAYLLLY
ncbi:hypothetical protein T05_14656 [Trichinella murrelli]|uniref:Uncharacterized protein n=1 Tax=Trichinella murrelli TaxID=144512 RepID=A0A0V0UGI6_9BILA|nr:hypothetical protein T05_14656 [Trichinella murrelli]